jgi:transposase
VETERDALLAAQRVTARAPAAMLLDIKGIGPEFAATLWSEGLARKLLVALFHPNRR